MRDFSGRFFVWVVAAVSSVIAVPHFSSWLPVGVFYNVATAQAEDETGRRAQTHWPSARALLSDADFARFEDLLNRSRCDEAVRLLNKRFLAKVKNSKHHALNAGGGMEWTARYRTKEPAIDFCLAKRQFDFESRKIEKDGLAVGRIQAGFPGDRPKGFHWAWRFRDVGAGYIIQLAERDHPDALVLFASWIENSNMFDVPLIEGVLQSEPAFELYLLKRACKMEYECGKLASRIAFLETTLRPADVAKVGEWIASARNLVFDLIAWERNPGMARRVREGPSIKTDPAFRDCGPTQPIC